MIYTPTFLRIINTIGTVEMSLSDIAKSSGLSYTAVIMNIAAMEELKMIISERKTKDRVCRLTASSLKMREVMKDEGFSVASGPQRGPVHRSAKSGSNVSRIQGE